MWPGVAAAVPGNNTTLSAAAAAAAATTLLEQPSTLGTTPSFLIFFLLTRSFYFTSYMVGGYVCTSLVFVEAVLVLMLPCKDNTRLILDRQGAHLPSVCPRGDCCLLLCGATPSAARGRRGEGGEAGVLHSL